MPSSRPRMPSLWVWLAAILVVNIVVGMLLDRSSSTTRVEIAYSSFKQAVTADQVESITVNGEQIEGHARQALQADQGTDRSQDFVTTRPAYEDPTLEALLEGHKVKVVATSQGSSILWTVLISFGPVLLLVGAFIFLARRSAAASGGAGLFGMGRSRARLYDPAAPKVTFDDVAGVDEAKAELSEVVAFLREPQRFQRLGGTMPKGVLLVGAPGTGKTLLARAVAGEAGVPYFSVAASEFVEMIVGVGAARVRDLFAKARAAAPAIIFVDELDAIGRTRSATLRVGGHDEQEQTLNQVLTEMDGFDSREGVVVLAATNRPDVLDSALLRPGRFDRQVQLESPDRTGRAAILRVHSRGVTLAGDVDLERVAEMTPGLVGADLRNLVNEAALVAARRDRSAVTAADFEEALEKVMLGAERHIVMSLDERRHTAYHEAGHAVVGLLLPGADPVRKVSIVPRGRSLGATVQAPVDERHSYPEEYLRTRIAGALGGRAAELIVFGETTTGAESDLRQVMHLAHEMVVRWGMSPRLGPLQYTEDADGATGLIRARPYSETTARLIDAEVKRIVDECQERARSLLGENRPALDRLAAALLQAERLDGDAIAAAAGLPAPAPATAPAAPDQDGGRPAEIPIPA